MKKINLSLVIIICVVVFFSCGKNESPLKITSINEKYESMKEVVSDEIHRENENIELKTNKNIFVINFKGDIEAAGVESLREEVTAILLSHSKNDEVVIKLESPGGLVSGYGLASAQILRLKRVGIKVTVSIDIVAASGGYLMAVVADKIVASKFAVVGSIGVIAGFHNFNELLDKYGINYELFTAGNTKRTVTVFGKNDKEGRSKFQKKLEETHNLFKDVVFSNRKVDIKSVSTGESWYAEDALSLGLIDEVKTSDELLLELSKTTSLYLVEYKRKVSATSKIKKFLSQLTLSIIRGLSYNTQQLKI